MFKNNGFSKFENNLKENSKFRNGFSKIQIENNGF